MSGKTTLVMELIKAGATYYSDDMAIFDTKGWVHPFPQPLAVRESEGRRKYTPEFFDRRTGTVPVPVGTILVTEYDRHGVWRPQPLSPSQALMALLDNTVAARKAPWVSLPILKRIATHAIAIKTHRGEAAVTAQTLLATLSSPPPQSNVIRVTQHAAWPSQAYHSHAIL